MAKSKIKKKKENTTNNSKKNIFTNDEMKIIDFYLFHCPIEYANGNKVSIKAKTFREMGITKNKMVKLLNEIEKKGLKIIYCKIMDRDKVNNMNSRNYIIYNNLSNLGKTKSLFYCIRNALAHGNFEFENKSLLGENFYKNQLRGKFIITNKLLLEIIKCIENLANNN